MDFLQRPLKRQKQFTEDVDVPSAREESQLRFESRLGDVMAKYGRDFTGIGDEIDMATGQLVVNNGHLNGMRGEADVGADHVYAANLHPDDEEAGWVSTSEDGNADESSSSGSGQSVAHARAVRQMGENIAAEITRIFTEYGVYSADRRTNVRPARRQSPSPARQRPPDHRSALRPFATPPAHRAEPTWPSPSRQGADIAPAVSVWDPRPSPQVSTVRRPYDLVMQHRGVTTSATGFPTENSGVSSGYRPPWSDEDSSLIMSLYEQGMPYEEIAERVPDRSLGAVRQQIQLRLRLARKRGHQVATRPIVDSTPASSRPLLSGLLEAALDDQADTTTGSPVNERVDAEAVIPQPNVDMELADETLGPALHTPGILKQTHNAFSAEFRPHSGKTRLPTDRRVAFNAVPAANITTPTRETSGRTAQRYQARRSESATNKAVSSSIPSSRRRESASKSDSRQITAVDQTPSSIAKPHPRARPSRHAALDDAESSGDELG